VKGVRDLAAVDTTMSKRFWETGILKVIKGEEICKDKGTSLGVRSKQHIAFSGVFIVTERGSNQRKFWYVPLYICVKAVYW